MIEEAYVSCEIAKLLKEKGFEGECNYSYIDEELYNKWDYDYPSQYELDNVDDEAIDAPTQQMAMR